VRTISRNEAEYTRERKVDVVRMQRNPDPSQHPFEKAREYTRALNAVKLDKIFAKPFVAALSGHTDSVFSLWRHSDSLSHVFSGSCDGGMATSWHSFACAVHEPWWWIHVQQSSTTNKCFMCCVLMLVHYSSSPSFAFAELKVWNLATRACLATIPAHRGFVRGIAQGHGGDSIITAGDDKTIKIWPLSLDTLRQGLPEDIQVRRGTASCCNVSSLTHTMPTFCSSPQPRFWVSTHSPD